MNGSPSDLGVRRQSEPLPSDESVTEAQEFAKKKEDIDDKEKRRILRQIVNLTYGSYFMMFLFLFLDGASDIPFDLDTWVLIALIGGVTGSSTATYFWKKLVDHAITK